jgi:hypothetical protein
MEHCGQAGDAMTSSGPTRGPLVKTRLSAPQAGVWRRRARAPWCSIHGDGSLPLDSCYARRMPPSEGMAENLACALRVQVQGTRSHGGLPYLDEVPVWVAHVAPQFRGMKGPPPVDIFRRSPAGRKSLAARVSRPENCALLRYWRNRCLGQKRPPSRPHCCPASF